MKTFSCKTNTKFTKMRKTQIEKKRKRRVGKTDLDRDKGGDDESVYVFARTMDLLVASPESERVRAIQHYDTC